MIKTVKAKMRSIYNRNKQFLRYDEIKDENQNGNCWKWH